MSNKRTRSPSGDSGYVRHIRGRNDYDSRQQDYNERYRSERYRNEDDTGNSLGERNLSSRHGHEHRGSGRRSYPDYHQDNLDLTRSGGIDFTRRSLGSVGHSSSPSSWGISTDSWSSNRVSRDYQHQSPQLVPNPLYSPHQSDRRRSDDRNHGGGGDGRYSRSSDQQRSNAVFLEEVNLPPKFAFRLDSTSDTQLLTAKSTEPHEKPNFFPTFYRDNVLGATEEYIKKNNVRSYLTKSNDKEENPEEEEEQRVQTPPPPGTSPVKIRPTSTKSIQYIAMSTPNPKGRKNLEVKEDLSMAEKRENFNVLTRQYPEDVQIWRDFVNFQDEDLIDMKRKARIEKKVAILEKALRTNPKSSELHFDRLDLLNEILKASDVLTEWEKLVGANEDSEVIWIERFKFVATQLQLCSSLGKEFSKGFEKLRRMLSPSYPAVLPKPTKFHLLVPDLLLGYTWLLRNSGCMEKSIALCQAQLEFDFNFPPEGEKLGRDKSGWKEIVKLFEIFWSLDTLRFGEPGCERGWKQILDTSPELVKKTKGVIGVADSEVVTFEDAFFESVNDADAQAALTRKSWTLAKCWKWVWIESLRSKFYWIPWRPQTSDIAECEDTQRMISSEVVTPYVVQIPSTVVTRFQTDSACFRHTVNYLLLLAHDFLPRTHTLESILSPFSSLTLTDISVFWSELNYWEKLTDFYHSKPKSSCQGVETIPEGFLLPDYTLPSTSTVTSGGKKLPLTPLLSTTISSQQESLLDKNQVKFHALIRSVVRQALDHLPPTFASLLVQMLLRYEQKSLYTRTDDVNESITFCKELLKHEKVRDSIEGYIEISLLEHFAGRRKKAVTLLSKTIASTSKILKEEMNLDEERSNSVAMKDFLETNWDKLAGIVRANRILAEFHLKEDRAEALRILTGIGNQFQELSKGQCPSKVEILKCKRLFEGIMNQLITKGEEKDEGLIEIDCEDEDNNLNDFDKWDGLYCLEYFGQRTNLVVEWTVAYGLFTYLIEETFEAASVIFGRVINKFQRLEPLSRSNKYLPRVVNCHNICEQLYISWCKLGALHVTLHPMQNAKFRHVFAKALELYPSSPPLLLLYMNVESQCSVVGKLWRAMVNIVKEPNPTDYCTLDWAPLFMCYGLAKQIEEIEQDSEIALDEFGIGGPAVPPDTIFYKLDAIFNAAENNLLTRNCPLIWRLHLKHLVIRAKEGKDDRRAHGLFYEAIRRCPSTKALYMDAIFYFPEMMKEVMDLMSQNQVTVRLPSEELDLLLEFNGKEEDEEEVIVIEEEEQRRSKKLKKGKSGKKLRKRKKKSKDANDADEVVAIEIVSD